MVCVGCFINTNFLTMELFNSTLSFAPFFSPFEKAPFDLQPNVLWQNCLPFETKCTVNVERESKLPKLFSLGENKWLVAFQTFHAVWDVGFSTLFRVDMFLCHLITKCFLSHSWRCALSQLKSIVCCQLWCWKNFLWGWNDTIHLCKSPLTDAWMKREMECEQLCTSHSVFISAALRLHNCTTISFPSYFLFWQFNLHLAQWKHCSL